MWRLEGDTDDGEGRCWSLSIGDMLYEGRVWLVRGVCQGL